MSETDFDRIYLTEHDMNHEFEPPLWCEDRVSDDDIEYVNVRLYNDRIARIADLETKLTDVKADLALHKDLRPFSENDMAMMRTQRDVARERIAELEKILAEYVDAAASIHDPFTTEPTRTWEMRR